jgi:RNA polymerase sigma factor (TIGR02999 family)
MPSDSGDITRLLVEIRQGDREALDRLFPLVYDELRGQAHRQLVHRSPGETLNTTALVHEAYIRLAASPLAVEDRRHFFAVAAKAMRQIAVDYARRVSAQKRGGGAKAVTLEWPADVAAPMPASDVVALDDALSELALLDERLARMVELRFFAGLSVEETAEVMDVSPRTVKRDWQKARAFLYQSIRGDAG